MLVTAETPKRLQTGVSPFQRASCKVSASMSLGEPSRLHPRGHCSFRGVGGWCTQQSILLQQKRVGPVWDGGTGFWRPRHAAKALARPLWMPFSEKKRVRREEGAPLKVPHRTESRVFYLTAVGSLSKARSFPPVPGDPWLEVGPLASGPGRSCPIVSVGGAGMRRSWGSPRVRILPSLPVSRATVRSSPAAWSRAPE